MEVRAHQIGKKFGRNWVFRDFDYTFSPNGTYAITGNNGSGKTTLLKILAGLSHATVGELAYTHNGEQIPVESVYRHIAFTGPYMELIEEFNLKEIIDFFAKFRELAVSKEELLDKLGLRPAMGRPIKHYSSGMKQKLKLGLALFSEASLIMLDEPTSNLDKQNIEWYLAQVNQDLGNKTLLICSNQEHEYSFCEHRIQLNKYKY